MVAPIRAAVFEFFVRTLPPRRRFLLAADRNRRSICWKTLRFSAADIDWLSGTGRFKPDNLLDYLRPPSASKATCTPYEKAPRSSPTSRSCASPAAAGRAVCRDAADQYSALPVTGRRESRRAVLLAAPDKLLVDFRICAARSTPGRVDARRGRVFVAGFAWHGDGAGRRSISGIPLYGTMAHSFIRIVRRRGDGVAECFARSRGRRILTTLLLDTYDTEAAARKVVALVADG